MARIRTIKPEFFTSEDIVSLSPWARLLYIALWCEADREGRMLWKPRTFKMRYLPVDDLDVEVVCGDLLKAGLIVLYGDGYAYIPRFAVHQHVNPRETSSSLPDPHAPVTRRARVRHASVTVETRDSDAQVGREGKGREGEDASGSTRPVAAALTLAHPLLSIPLNDGTEYGVSQVQLQDWSALFPGVDVMQELRKMRAWSLAKPSRRKTRRGVEGFAVTWLGKAQDTGRGKRDEGVDVFAGVK